MVCTINKYIHPNIHVLSISPPYCSHKANMFPDIIVLDPFTTFQTYDLISCDITCDCSHVPLHYSRKLKEMKMKNKNKNRK